MDVLKNRFDLGFFPTPLQPLHNLSRLYPYYNLFIKRDDNTGLATGGNKTRKLEYFIYKALDEGYTSVLTAGAQQSNHCRQTAAACALAGLKCHLMVGGGKPAKYNGNLLLSSLLGAQIHFTGEKRKGENLPSLKHRLEEADEKCLIVPYGGSNGLGALGFVNAARELKNQLAAQEINIDYIFFATSSGATQAGLMLGKDLFGLNFELMPVRVDKAKVQGRDLQESILNIISEGADLLNFEKSYALNAISINGDYDGAGYGVITDNEITAINELAKYEGILLDPVYTGRAFYGMMDCLKKRKIKQNSNVLFWHTGGIPALFEYAPHLVPI